MKSEPGGPEVSIVMPCLNEADTLETCLLKARQGLREGAIEGEIIVADNGSTDASIEIAGRCGARVVPVKARGYGSALMGGIAAARGQFVIMGDADDSYDFREVPKFVAKLREGFDLVQGCRLPAGGGRVASGAMPWSHRWIGNPAFSWMTRHWFRASIHDVYCGLRGFKKDWQASLNQRCSGMEFATEMIIKASLFGASLAEVPITLHPDGRKAHAPHLKTIRDGWRTLRFFLLYSPQWLFSLPGLFLVLLGLAGYVLVFGKVRIGSLVFEAHTLLYASIGILCGFQAMLFAVFGKTFAVNEGLLPEDAGYRRYYRYMNLERGLVAGFAAVCAGMIVLTGVFLTWRGADFGRLDYAQTMRWAIPGATLVALGIQTLFASFMISLLGMKRQ